MKESKAGMNTEQNPKEIARTNSGICILKVTRYQTQGKTDIEATSPRHILVEQLDFKD